MISKPNTTPAHLAPWMLLFPFWEVQIWHLEDVVSSEDWKNQSLSDTENPCDFVPIMILRCYRLFIFLFLFLKSCYFERIWTFIKNKKEEGCLFGRENLETCSEYILQAQNLKGYYNDLTIVNLI